MSCARAPDRLFDWLPNFARACGRVSVGGHPDKRPDSRLRKDLLPCTRDRQPEAKTGAARSPRATRLKATTERAFLVTAGRKAGSPKRLVLLCRACRSGLPVPDQGSNRATTADGARRAG